MTETGAEIWRDIPGYEGHYQASNLGRVKALARTIIVANHRCNRKSGESRPCLKPLPERVLTNKRSCRSRGGYYWRVQLYLNGCCIMPGVHQLVMLAFSGPPAPGQEVNHKDGNPSNNCLSNLEYITRSENLRHARTLGRARGADAHMAKLTEADVLAIRAAYPEVSIAELTRRYGLKSRGTVEFIVKRKTWAYL